MKIINKLTLRHLKNNRSRTILTTIGICASVAMITAVLIGLHSYLDYQGRLTLYTGGDYHFSVNSTPDKIEEILGGDKRVDSYGIYEYIDSSVSGYRLKNAKYKHKSVGSWVAGDKNYLEQMITTAYDGRFPESSHEIMVEEKFITDNELDWKIGDTVSIESGYRYIGSDFFRFPKRGEYAIGELFDYDSTDTYKITGILHKNLPTQYSGSIVRGVDRDNIKSCIAYGKLKRVTPFSLIEINSIIDKFGFSEKERLLGGSGNYEYLQTKLALSKFSTEMLSLLPMCAAVLLLIIAASVVLIYNSFGMSLNEKIKYLGMLSSVGATRKQKKWSVICEALMLSLVAVPLGMITGIGVLAVVFSLIGEKIKASAITGELGSSAAVDLNIKLSLVVVAVIIVISLATVLVSAMIPSKKASSVSAIDAIRQSEEIKIKHKIRTPFFIKKLFGYEGALAYKNMRRNGAKSRIIVVSIALSLVLFLGCNYFCNLFVITTGLDEEVPYQVSTDFNSGKDNETLKKFEAFVESQPEIKKYYLTTTEMGLSQDTPEDEIPLLDTFFREENFTKDYKELVDYSGVIVYRVLEDEVFNDLCKKNGIDYKEYYDYEYGCYDYCDNDDEVGFKSMKPVRVLLLNDFNHTDEKAGKPFTEKVIGSTQGEMSNPESEEYLKMEFGEDVEITEELRQQAREITDNEAWKEQYVTYGLVDYDKDNYIFHLDGANSIVNYLPMTVYQNKYRYDGYEDDGWAVDFGIETDTHAQITEALKQFMENNEIKSNVIDEEEWRDSEKAKIIVIQVLIYGFIILISIITITNIINTIANSVNNRKKEFAMLKSVGLTPTGFKKMLRLESLFYAFEGVLFGIPLSVLACYIINSMMTALTVPFTMDIKMCVISVCVVLGVIGLTMLYSSSKVRKCKIIDELKIEIN